MTDTVARGQGHQTRLGGQQRELTILFSDVEGFSRISDAMRPSDLVEHLGEYLRAMAATIETHHGSIDKFLGAGIQALFNAPLDVPDHALQACRAALRAQQTIEQLGERWRSAGKPVLRPRLGLHTGEAIVGNIGTPERFEYTVIGEAVNTARRVESLNRLYGTRLMGSESVRESAGQDFEWRALDCVAVPGHASSMRVSELLGEEGGVDARLLHARDFYEVGLRAYFDRSFHEAAEHFLAAAAARPGDVAAPLMAIRAERLARKPPRREWNGVYRAAAR